MQPTRPSSSSRILYDVPCNVCNDNSSGKHYGVYACDGCAGFFKRSIRRERNYICKARVSGSCIIDRVHRNQCRFCRLAKCIEAGMNRDAVQHERGPRNSTIRRQMELFSQDNNVAPSLEPTHSRAIMPEPSLLPPTMPLALSLFSFPLTHFNGFNLINSLPLFPQPTFSLPLLPMMNFHHGNEAEMQCEAAARLLFLNVRWTKTIISFESLSLPDRLVLLEESWIELFVLGVAQFIYPLDLNALLKLGWTRIDRSFVDVFESVLKEIVRVKPDNEEYKNLRSVILFKTVLGGRSTMGTQMRRLQDLTAVTAAKNRAQAALNIHTVNSYPLEPTRTSDMYKILRMLKTVSGHTIIELFFRNAIGNINVERIITQMYKSEAAPEIEIKIF